jgi:hypothetical protein
MARERLRFFERAISVEAALWVGMAAWCALRGVRVRSGGMGVLSIALVMFGLSEVVDVRMGAWYRPGGCWRGRARAW